MIFADNFDFYSNNCIAYVMNRKNSIDIDTNVDFIIAETMLSLVETENYDQ